MAKATKDSARDAMGNQLKAGDEVILRGRVIQAHPGGGINLTIRVEIPGESYGPQFALDSRGVQLESHAMRVFQEKLSAKIKSEIPSDQPNSPIVNP